MPRLPRVLLASLAFAVLCCGFATAARADTINFDTDANGNPINAPCVFTETTPLTNLYAPLGVTFSGPSAGTGGAILDQCGSFGVNARSGRNFLAFNRSTYALDPETITFETLVSEISIFASGGFQTTTFSLNAFDTGGVLLGSNTVTALAGMYGQLSFSSVVGIRRVVLTAGANVPFFVYDDLTFTPIPEPTTVLLLGTGLAGAGAAVRRQRKARKSNEAWCDGSTQTEKHP